MEEQRPRAGHAPPLWAMPPATAHGGALGMSLEDLLTWADKFVDVLHRWMRHQQGCATKMRRSQRDQQTRGLRQDDRCQCDQNGLQVTELGTLPQYIQETPAHKSHALLSEAPSSGPADQLQPRPVLDWRPLSPLQRKTWDLSLPGDTTRGHLGASQVSDQLKILLLDIHNVGV